MVLTTYYYEYIVIITDLFYFAIGAPSVKSHLIFTKPNCDRSWQLFFFHKGQIINVVGFTSHGFSPEIVIDGMQMSEHGRAPIKLSLHNWNWVRFGPWVLVGLLLLYAGIPVL